MARGDDLVLKVSADTSTVAAGLKPMTTALDAIEAEATSATKGLERLEAEVDDLGHKRVDIDVRQEAIDKARARVDALRDEIAEGIVLDVDTRAAQRELSTLERTIKTVLAFPPAEVNVDTERAEANVEELDADLKGLHDRKVEVNVDVNKEGVKGVEALREGVRETSTSVTQLGTGLTGMSILALAAIPALADLNETLDDMKTRNAEAGRESGRLLRSTSAVTSFIGGPWGLALVAGASLLAAFASKQDEAEEATKQFREALDLQAGAFDRNNRALVVKQLQEAGALDVAEKFGVNIDELVTRILQQKDATDLLAQSSTFASAQQDLFHDKNTDAADSVSTLVNAIGTTTTEVGKAEYSQLQLGRALLSVNDATDAQGAAMNQTTGVWQHFNTELDAAQSNLDALVNSLDGLNAALGDTRAAQAAQARTTEDLNKALKENKHTLDLATDAGRTNDALIREQAANIVKVRDARLKDAAASGESTDDIIADYGKQRKSLDDTATKLGGNTKFAQDYVDTLLATPEDIESQVKVTGINAAESAINHVARDREAAIDVEVNLNTNYARFNRLPKRVQDAISGNGSINLNVNAASSAPVAPAPSVVPSVFLSPRLYLDSRPIRAALKGDVESVVSSTVAATSHRGRL
jgi:predicted  nucleic acid-binding Zn-ribbon protein